MVGEKATVNLLALQKSIQESLRQPEAKEACLSFEYKLLLLYSAQFGVYVMPQLDTLHIWHGLLFVRYGLFKDARLKFKLSFDEFPRQPPRVHLLSEVYHPMVDPASGELDLGEDIRKHWNYGKHIRLTFIDVKKYETPDSLNPKAAELFKTNVDEFFIRVRECVETSRAQLYTNHPDTPLKLLPFNERHKKIKDSLSSICEDVSLSQEERKRKFLRALKDS